MQQNVITPQDDTALVLKSNVPTENSTIDNVLIVAIAMFTHFHFHLSTTSSSSGSTTQCECCPHAHFTHLKPHDTNSLLLNA